MSSVPRPKPEKNVSADAKNATTQMISVIIVKKCVSGPWLEFHYLQGNRLGFTIWQSCTHTLYSIYQMSTIKPSSLLTIALLADAAVSGTVALLQVSASSFLSGLLSLPQSLIFESGVFLLAYT